jgi:phosphatidylinositol kinase/protein kinase (PI-3  family)
MLTRVNTIDKIYSELQTIKEQVESTQACAKNTYLLKSNVAMVETKIEQSLNSLNHLLQSINDYKRTSKKK